MTWGESIKAFYAAVPWTELALTVAGLWLVTQLYRMHMDKENRFVLGDMIVDKRGRADLYKLILIVMAGLSIYTVLKLLEGDKPVETLLLGVLAIFVGGRSFNAAFAKDDQSVEVKSEGEK
jgi:hypothetical protein